MASSSGSCGDAPAVDEERAYRQDQGGAGQLGQGADDIVVPETSSPYGRAGRSSSRVRPSAHPVHARSNSAAARQPAGQQPCTAFIASLPNGIDPRAGRRLEQVAGADDEPGDRQGAATCTSRCLPAESALEIPKRKPNRPALGRRLERPSAGWLGAGAEAAWSARVLAGWLGGGLLQPGETTGPLAFFRGRFVGLGVAGVRARTRPPEQLIQRDDTENADKQQPSVLAQAAQAQRDPISTVRRGVRTGTGHSTEGTRPPRP